MKKQIFVAVITMSFCFHSLLEKTGMNCLFAQKQHNQWQFGINQGLDFNSGAPVAVTGGQMAPVEGNSSVADSCTGDLLFYTDGTKVWDASHVVMPNGTGLMGGPSSVQSAIIIPSVGNPKQYYIFTTDEFGGANGFRYTVVDMSMPGNGTVLLPLGEVIAAQKNILLSTPTSERLTACMHSNCRDIWVLEHSIGSNVFKAWLVTSSGVSAAPVTSNIGSVPSRPYGFMRLSHNGKKLILCTYYLTGSNAYLYDFDNSSGMVSNQQTISSTLNVPYSGEFSPNDNLFYITYNGGIDQFETNVANIPGSQVFIAGAPEAIGMQLGPDCKIYCGNNAVISNPDSKSSPGYASTTLPTGRFPNMLIWKPKACTPNAAGFTYTPIVCSLTIQFNDTSTDCTIKSRRWDFGDIVSGAANTSILQNPSHTFSAAGTYTVTLILNKGGCLADTATATVTVNPATVTFTVISNAMCGNNNGQAAVVVTGGSIPFTYNWSPSGGTNAIATGLAAGNYTATVTDASGCSATQTVTVVSSNIITTNQSVSICSGFTYTLPGGTVVSSSGTYNDTLTAVAGCDSIIITTLTVHQNPTANAASNVTITQGQSITLTASGGGSYSWSNGAIGSVITISPNSTTAYCVTVTDANNCSDIACVTVTIQELLCGALYVPNAFAPPNAFTPNGDNENERLCVYGNCIEKIEFVIYNRWGEKVFETTSPPSGGWGACWDGTYRGKPEKTAVFVYYLEATLTNGEKISRKGNISLIR